jgi:hypothetical protein
MDGWMKLLLMLFAISLSYSPLFCKFLKTYGFLSLRPSGSSDTNLLKTENQELRRTMNEFSIFESKCLAFYSLYITACITVLTASLTDAT